ncbi:MAG: type II toxin-antitoxin system RelE/ParE family toxin [Erysipelotrichaceae bacterium]|nr:type II toxin-antitoxin system RelE/ParE family toxin [Erysipelotrichaceae bacterium]MBR5048320.1 type II toxin-antitoxin system RelE/ParE family toxin [Erysipelotrichaceae bacterium]
MFIIEFFQENDGTCPAEEFLRSLDKKMKAKVEMIMQLLEQYGNRVTEPYSKHLDDGIFEIRAAYSSNSVRILYFFYYGKRIIMTNGFVKKTQETPPQEIELAKKRRQRFLSRGGK